MVKRKLRQYDDDDESASRGLSKGAVIGIVAGGAGLLLVASIVTAVLLARNASKTTTPVTQGNPPTTTPARPGLGTAPVPPQRDLSLAAFRDIVSAFNPNRSNAEKRLGPGTPVSGAEMRKHVEVNGIMGDLLQVEADYVFNRPVSAFYKWKTDKRAIYVAFNSKDPSGVFLCAVYEGPDVPFNKTHEFLPNLSILNHLP